MMTAAIIPNVVVLRAPEDQGNFRYWLAELSRDDARRWEERLANPTPASLDPEFGDAFGDPMTLPQVMEKLQQRDFQVLEFPVHWRDESQPGGFDAASLGNRSR
jgi:hypothetical protein